MNSLFKSNHYHWALFIGHLVIEKLLKSIYVKKKSSTPFFSHDLLRIVDKIGGVKLTNEQKDILDTISSFNIAARYDDYKRIFYKKCTKEYTIEWIKKIKEIRKWLKENYLK
jgi:HEPN domain-containing protein